MKRCVIHIGMHKTGSTSIQLSFFNQLNNSEWKYANIGSSNHGPTLQRILHEELPRQNKADGSANANSNEALNKLIKDLEQEGENYLLSGEWLSTNIGLPTLTALRDLLLLHVEKITVMGYVRSPRSFMESSFQERLKRSALKLDFKYFPRYRLRLEPFDIVFGKENVMLAKFNPATFKKGCVVQDFCHRLDIEFPETLVKRRNESLSREAIAFLYTYRNFLNKQEADINFSIRENEALVNYLTKLKGSKLRFATEAINPILTKNQTHIEWMENRLNESLEEPYEDSADAIRSEDDLLRYKPEDLMWLAEQLGSKYIDKYQSNMKPKQVARWMLALHLKVIEKNSGHQKMSLKKLVRNAKKNTPELEAIPEAQAIALLTNVFQQISKKTEDINEGRVRVSGLGRFQINQVKHDKDGQKTTTKRVFFQSLKIKDENQ